MGKIFYLFFFIFFLFSLLEITFAEQKLSIISREEWGARDEYLLLAHEKWQEIISKEVIKQKKEQSYLSIEDTIAYLQKPDYRPDIEKYLYDLYKDYRELESVSVYDGNGKLFWPIQQAKNIGGIIIHHTHIDFGDDYETVRKIYYSHTFERQWGDIGYNFLIGKNGEIFEGRKGGEKAVGAHTKWNNIGNIGIALIGDYDHQDMTLKQKESLQILVTYLIEKYNINIHKQIDYHIQCIQENCENPISSLKNSPIIGHSDAGHTNCPGEYVQKYLLSLRQHFIYNVIGEKNIHDFHVEPIFGKYNYDELQGLSYRIKKKIIVTKIQRGSERRIYLYQQIYNHLQNYLQEKYM